VTVSAVIVNFRAYAELRACLRALLAPHGLAFEVVVVDQAPVREEFARIRHEFPGVTFVESRENRGFAAGVNLGVSRSRGEALLLLNPDCEITPEAVERLAAWLSAHPKVGAVGPRVLDPNGSVQASARKFPALSTAFAGRSSWLTRAFPGNRFTRRNLVETRHLAEPREVDWVSGACVMLRRDALDEVGGMDSGFFLYWEDADLGRRLKDVGRTTVYHPGVEVVHTVGGSSRFAPVRSAFAFHRSALRYFWKHSGAAARLAAPLAAVGLAARLFLVLAWNYSRRFVGLGAPPATAILPSRTSAVDPAARMVTSPQWLEQQARERRAS
jgi:GT2 family glycosyltransferase